MSRAEPATTSERATPMANDTAEVKGHYQGMCFGFGRDAELVPRAGAQGIIRDQFVGRIT
jgi:hypothetical protein